MLAKILILFVAFTAINCDDRVRFLYYGGVDWIETTEYNAGNLETILQNPWFDRQKETIIFHYGAGQTISTPEVHEIIIAYIFNREYNFIIVTYEDVRTISTGNANDLAAGITSGLTRLLNNGFPSARTQLVGFALGAQIVARSSRQLRNLGHHIGKLTGLNPWDLGLISSITIGTLSPSDATWVESIHTESGNRGDIDSHGHAAFHVNGGIAQPMCTHTLASNRHDCAHNFALIFWAEAIRSPAQWPAFPAVVCRNWDIFLTQACNSFHRAHMSRSRLGDEVGTYMLRTNMVPPWSRDTVNPWD